MSAPVFAYYYMWMHGNYWHTNKLDHPLQPPGDYSSDDPAVIKLQIKQAQTAGISGFICSWKNNPWYQKVLPLVMAAANEAGFKLALEYETLNASKIPQSSAAIIRDLSYFISNYASNPCWHLINGNPFIIIDDTNWYTPATVSVITSGVKDRLSILADVPTPALYSKYASYVDGNAYYWSSQGSVSLRAAQADLTALGQAVHASKGIWIPSFSPGFNATHIGGKPVVPRNNGLTLQDEHANALASSPDIMGLISWNEWTENTYTEPSVLYGSAAITTLKDLVG
jgi:hypothetical protein